jgi:hypothetical protein
MKGSILAGVLERAGLIRLENDPPQESAPATPPAPAVAPLATQDVSSLSLEQIYAAAGVPASSYPAERLLRLIDGLKAMDDTTRRQAIAAMDAADDSWTIADPVADATTKIDAIEHHAKRVLATVDAETQRTADGLAEIQKRVDTTVTGIKRQIADLEALQQREITRAAEESATLEANLRAFREASSRELLTLKKRADEFRALVAQVAQSTPTSPPA